MPFIIAAMLYVALAVPALGLLGVVCWVRRGRTTRAVVGGAVGSVAGFALGCVASTLFILTGLAAGANIGATALIALPSLALALAGMAAGTAVLCMGSPGNTWPPGQ